MLASRGGSDGTGGANVGGGSGKGVSENLRRNSRFFGGGLGGGGGTETGGGGGMSSKARSVTDVAWLKRE
jgi:hypothetical protein